MIGSLAEAKQIFNAAGDRWKENVVLPYGWEECGDGSTRVAFLSPSGIVYKICKSYDVNYPSENVHEEKNFRAIKEKGLLPLGWYIPEVTLYRFKALYTQWDRFESEPREKWGQVDVLACEYIPGPEETLDQDTADVVFSHIGLSDPTTFNVKVHGETQDYYIIDAGEWVEAWPEPVAA